MEYILSQNGWAFFPIDISYEQVTAAFKNKFKAEY
jgi:hypothetical protein